MRVYELSHCLHLSWYTYALDAENKICLYLCYFFFPVLISFVVMNTLILVRKHGLIRSTMIMSIGFAAECLLAPDRHILESCHLPSARTPSTEPPVGICNQQQQQQQHEPRSTAPGLFRRLPSTSPGPAQQLLFPSSFLHPRCHVYVQLRLDVRVRHPWTAARQCRSG